MPVPPPMFHPQDRALRSVYNHIGDTNPSVIEAVIAEARRWADGQRRLPNQPSPTDTLDAWNSFVTHHNGAVAVRARCTECGGKGFSTRALARTGTPVCRTCMGRRRARFRVPIRPIPVPSTDRA